MSEWISVGDKLPEYGAEVIVSLNYKRRKVACFSYRGRCEDTGRLLWCWHNSDEESTLTVTHWMPLPEPPSEKKYQIVDENDVVVDGLTNLTLEQAEGYLAMVLNEGCGAYLQEED